MLSYNKYDIETTIWSSYEEAIDHGIVVSNLAYLISREMNMKADFCYDMAVAGLVHDIGKIKIQTYLEQNYTEIMAIDEARYIRMHPTTGYAILKEYGFHDRILSAVLNHHEHYDGSGYPSNLKGEDIPIEGRILHVADCFGALISNRPYRSAFDIRTAVDVMIDEVKNFDMKVYLVLQNLAFSREFRYVLEQLGIK